MLTVRELRALASRLTAPVFQQQLGPFVLVQRVPEPLAQRMAMEDSSLRTTVKPSGKGFGQVAAEMSLRFDDLTVASLPPLRAQDVLSVGRLPDGDSIIEDPSVSKRHAVLRWDASIQQCLLEDLESTNGTEVNGQTVDGGGRVLLDGDVVSFGDADFCYLATERLWTRLTVRATR